MEPFRTEPYSDFTNPEPKAAYREALETVTSKLGGHVPLVIDGKPVATDERITSIDPARPETVVGTTGCASRAEAQLALDAAKAAFVDWSRRPADGSRQARRLGMDHRRAVGVHQLVSR